MNRLQRRRRNRAFIIGSLLTLGVVFNSTVFAVSLFANQQETIIKSKPVQVCDIATNIVDNVQIPISDKDINTTSLLANSTLLENYNSRFQQSPISRGGTPGRLRAISILSPEQQESILDTTTENNTIDTNEEPINSSVDPEPVVEEPKIYTVEKISKNSDLATFNPITEEQMNKIISGFRKDSPFQGHGDIFIKAGEVSGLNPLYIFAHASLETGYGTSGYARTHNYFGIGAFDSNPDNAHNYSNDSMENGIINGAVWIKQNWYDKGYTSLYDMIHTAPHAYASTRDKWISDIVWIANAKISLANN